MSLTASTTLPTARPHGVALPASSSGRIGVRRFARVISRSRRPSAAHRRHRLAVANPAHAAAAASTATRMYNATGADTNAPDLNAPTTNDGRRTDGPTDRRRTGRQP